MYGSFSHCSVFINAPHWWEMTVELLQRRRKEWRNTQFTLQKHSVLFHLRAWRGKTDDIIKEQFEVTGRTREAETENIKTSSIICWDVQERGFSVCLVNWHNVSLVSMRSTEVAACTDTMVTAGILGRSNMSLASRTHINTLGSNRGGL